VYFPSEQADATEQDDATLVTRTLAGDQAAFGGLVRRYQKVLYTVALRMLGNPEDARDATQTAFVRAYEGLSSFDEQYRFFSWIYRILMNECLNVLRGRRPETGLSPVLATTSGPFEAAVSGERRAQIQAALLRLTPDYRAAIVLRHFGGLSYDEMADALGVPAKTVKSRLHTARQRLGALLLGWKAQ
jgi:RNA polymerase sigma-70 factor, ECF subfamily